MHEAGGAVAVVVVAAAAAAHCAEAVAGPWCGCHAGLPNHCSKSRTKGKQTRGRTEGKRKKVDNQKKKKNLLSRATQQGAVVDRDQRPLYLDGLETQREAAGRQVGWMLLLAESS